MSRPTFGNDRERARARFKYGKKRERKREKMRKRIAHDVASRSSELRVAQAHLVTSRRVKTHWDEMNCVRTRNLQILNTYSNSRKRNRRRRKSNLRKWLLDCDSRFALAREFLAREDALAIHALSPLPPSYSSLYNESPRGTRRYFWYICQQIIRIAVSPREL
jgi:hypothetical protein